MSDEGERHKALGNRVTFMKGSGGHGVRPEFPGFFLTFYSTSLTFGVDNTWTLPEFQFANIHDTSGHN